MKDKKFKVRMERKDGWNTYGYFKMKDEIAVRKTVNEINQYNSNQPEDDFYHNEHFKVKEIHENPKRKNWKRRKAIKSFEGWKKQKNKLKSLHKEKADILIYVALGVSLILASCIYLFGEEFLRQVIYSSSSLKVGIQICLIATGLGIITLTLDQVKINIVEVISGVTGYVSFILISMLFLLLSKINNEILVLVVLYILGVATIWITLIAIYGILRKTYSIFLSTVEDDKKRLEILVAIFGTIISMIALFK